MPAAPKNAKPTAKAAPADRPAPWDVERYSDGKFGLTVPGKFSFRFAEARVGPMLAELEESIKLMLEPSDVVPVPSVGVNVPGAVLYFTKAEAKQAAKLLKKLHASVVD